LAVWIIAAVIIVGVSPKLSSIESDDQSSFLPSTYESVKAGEVGNKVSANSESPTDIILFKSTTGAPLTADEQKEITGIVA